MPPKPNYLRIDPGQLPERHDLEAVRRKAREHPSAGGRDGGPKEREAQAEKWNRGRRVTRPVRPAALPIVVARVQQDEVDADDGGHDRGHTASRSAEGETLAAFAAPNPTGP